MKEFAEKEVWSKEEIEKLDSGVSSANEGALLLLGIATELLGVWLLAKLTIELDVVGETDALGFVVLAGLGVALEVSDTHC